MAFPPPLVASRLSNGFSERPGPGRGGVDADALHGALPLVHGAHLRAHQQVLAALRRLLHGQLLQLEADEMALPGAAAVREAGALHLGGHVPSLGLGISGLR